MKALHSVLQDSQICLRPLVAADLPATMRWRNRLEVRKAFVHTDPITERGHAAWFEGYLAREDDLMWVIERKGQPIGQVGLYDITEESAEFGRLMIGDPHYRMHGYGSRATKLVVRYAFEVCGVTVVRLSVRRANDRAIRLYQRYGFVKVGADGEFLKMRMVRP